MNGTLTLVDVVNVSSEESQASTVSESDFGLDSIYRYDPDISVLLVVGYLSVFVVGLVGNSCVIWVVARTPRMRTVTNYLIVNLAFIDIVVLLVCVPSNLLSNLIHPWVLGVAMCKLTSFLQAVTVSASIQTLVIISVDRCVAICSTSLSQQIIPQYRVRRVITLIWTFSLLLMSPIAVYQDLVQATPDVPWYNCVDNYPTQKFRVVFNTVALFACCYVIPLLVITATYILIFVTVWKRSIPGECLNKVVKMMVCVVSTFFVSWAPLYLVHGYILFYGYPDNNEQIATFLQLVFPISQWLGMTNSCINPIFYAYFNQRFRHGFAAILGRRDRSEGSRDQRARQHKWTTPAVPQAGAPDDDNDPTSRSVAATRSSNTFVGSSNGRSPRNPVKLSGGTVAADDNSSRSSSPSPKHKNHTMVAIRNHTSSSLRHGLDCWKSKNSVSTGNNAVHSRTTANSTPVYDILSNIAVPSSAAPVTATTGNAPQPPPL